MIPRTVRKLLAVPALLACTTAGLRAQTFDASDYRGAEALGLALRRLGPTGRVLVIGAHPDDEDTQLLARLALGEGADVAYLSLTRGEGGQNAIGPDFQEALGIIRTEELLAARRVDGAVQFFGREYDYGFSKSADEAFRHWPRDSVLADVVRVIRMFRPDVVVSVWTGTPRDGHGQHQASGIVAKEAFVAAADPARFPEQLRAGLAPWRAQKLYEGSYFRQDSLTVRYDTGMLDPLLGLSYAEVAAISRGRHRSQDMARALPLGPRGTGVNLVRDLSGRAPLDRPETGLFEHVDTTLGARAATMLAAADPPTRLLASYDSTVAAARATYDPFMPGTLLSGLEKASILLAGADSLLAALPGARTATSGPDPRTARSAPVRAALAAGTTPAVPDAVELRWLIRKERRDLTAALADAAGLVFDAAASADQVVPGDSLELTLTLWNGGTRPVTLRELAPALPDGWRSQPLQADTVTAVVPGQLVTRHFLAHVPEGTAPTQPYYLRLPRQGDLYDWPQNDPADALPFQAPAFQATAVVALDAVPVQLREEVTFPEVTGRQGEVRRPVRVVPAVSVGVQPAIAVRPISSRTPQTLEVRLSALDPAGATGTLRPVLPPGWRIEPDSLPLRLGGGETRTIRFALRPPPGVAAGAYDVGFHFRSASGQDFARGFRLIDYPHIRPHPLYSPAAALVHEVDVTVPDSLRVGYIMGAGDDVPAALGQLGIRVEPLPPDVLATTDLSRFDDIVVGVRAYEVRPDLATANRRLLDWVRGGGTLLVQYQQAGWADYAPYPLSFARRADRVTDEDAPVTLLAPDSPALTRPNHIGPADWQGWVQERGLWFPRSWDSHWQPLLAMNDPGEAPLRGSLLVASYGSGTVVYTGLSFFRELPAGVPGAYRLFVNLLALGRVR